MEGVIIISRASCFRKLLKINPEQTSLQTKLALDQQEKGFIGSNVCAPCFLNKNDTPDLFAPFQLSALFVPSHIGYICIPWHNRSQHSENNEKHKHLKLEAGSALGRETGRGQNIGLRGITSC